MPRPSPQPAALALVIAHLISQLRIAKGRQAVRRNKLPLPRRKPFRIPSPSIVPLVRHPARLVNPRRKHPLQVSFRGNQRLSQINHFPFLPMYSPAIHPDSQSRARSSSCLVLCPTNCTGFPLSSFF